MATIRIQNIYFRSEAQPQQWDRYSKVVWQQDLNSGLCKKKWWQRIKNMASWRKLALAGVTFYVPMHQCAVHCNAPVIFVGLRIAMKIQFLFWIFKLLAMEYVDSRLVIPTLLFINGTAAVKL